MVKLRLKVGPKGQIIIPKILREKYGIRENDYVFIELRDDELVITRAPTIDETLERIRLRRKRLKQDKLPLENFLRLIWRRSLMRMFINASLFIYLNIPIPKNKE
jgi:AbrB family looped-hinge helix DNA binding protein